MFFMVFLLQKRFFVVYHKKTFDATDFPKRKQRGKALLCSSWQGHTPAPLNIAFVLQKQYRTQTPILFVM
jgi:hypothetical protein